MIQEVKIDLRLSGFYDPQCDNMNDRDQPLTLHVTVVDGGLEKRRNG
jgi:hypothetical protein